VTADRGHRAVAHRGDEREHVLDLGPGTLPDSAPVTATTSKIVYTLFFDNSMMADDAARERNLAQRKTTFTQALENMKILAEGGTLPPAPPRPATPGQ